MSDTAGTPDPNHTIALDIIDAWRTDHLDLFHYLVAHSIREFDTVSVIRQLAAIASTLSELHAECIGVSDDDHAATLRYYYTAVINPEETTTP